MVFELDMQPLAPCVRGLADGDRDHPAAAAAAAVRESDDGSSRKACDHPSDATFTKPTSCRLNRAQTQPRLWRSRRDRQPIPSLGAWPKPSACNASTSALPTAPRHL